MGVGFAAWPSAEHQLRVFALSPPGPVIAPLSAGKSATAKQLAELLARAGFPAQAPPPMLFRWVFRTMLTIHVAWMHAYRRAGWELDALATAPDLLGLCGTAMAESARTVRGGGPIASVARRIPARLFTHLVAKQARAASAGFKDVWRYHGPKCEQQLVVLTQQLLEHSHGAPMRALRELAEG